MQAPVVPRYIHYCWFGSQSKPAEVLRLVAQWKERLPGYEFVEWNEQNFDFTAYP